MTTPLPSSPQQPSTPFVHTAARSPEPTSSSDPATTLHRKALSSGRSTPLHSRRPSALSSQSAAPGSLLLCASPPNLAHLLHRSCTASALFTSPTDQPPSPPDLHHAAGNSLLFDLHGAGAPHPPHGRFHFFLSSPTAAGVVSSSATKAVGLPRLLHQQPRTTFSADTTCFSSTASPTFNHYTDEFSFDNLCTFIYSN